jgi:PAS domain S-box-containing protein
MDELTPPHSNHVLLVEDDPGVAQLIQEKLDRQGYRVTCVPSGQAAIDYAQQTSVWLIVLDYRLPDMTGPQIIATLAARGRSIPFIVTTGSGDEQVAVEMMKLGARDYLIKDLNFLDLLPATLSRLEEQLSMEKKLAEAEAARRLSDTRLRTLINAMPDIVRFKDGEGRWREANEFGLRLLQLARVDYHGKTDAELADLSPFYRATLLACAEADEEAWQAGHATQHEEVLPQPDGPAMVFDMIRVPTFTADGQRQGLITVGRDITARHQAEERLRLLNVELEQHVLARTAQLNTANVELKQANLALTRAARLKDDFLASMSHELRTPLTGILGLTEALQLDVYGPVNDKQAKSLHTIYESGQHLLALITDILDLSKLEAGKLELQLGAAPIEDLCQASLRFIKQLAHKKNLRVSVDYDRRVTTLLVDARRLKQMLVNLLSNAVKFTPPDGDIGLTVSADPVKGEVYFVVWDTGIGIAPDNLSRLFQPFTQIDSGLARQYEGSGLGLSLVQQMIELHGGQVTVESEVGRGSRFTLTLPWRIPPAEPAEAPYPSQPAAPTATRSAPGAPRQLASILLVDDNEATLTTLSDFLQNQTYQVRLAHNGTEALAQLHSARPDIMLIDIQMPGMDGLEVIQHIRAEAGCKALPIVAITALAMPGDQERCLAAGANAYLSKPLNLRQLSQTLQTLLKDNPQVA